MTREEAMANMQVISEKIAKADPLIQKYITILEDSLIDLHALYRQASDTNNKTNTRPVVDWREGK